MNNDNRDMFYGGYQGMMPIPGMYPNNYMPNSNPSYGNIESRVSKLENQIKLINNRLNKLENSYGNNPDNNMYMM